MKLTYFGHSCFAVEVGGKKLVFDPFVRPNELAKSVDFEGIEADYILVSHGHVDHIADAEDLAKRTGATVVSNFEIVTWLASKGVGKAHPMNHGGEFGFDFGRVKYTVAVHSSGLPDGTYGGNPGGFVVAADEGSFFFAGDSALTRDYELFGEAFDLQFAVLPIGDNFTMGAKDAAAAAEMLRCDDVVGVHYDTFPPIRINRAAAAAAFGAAGKRLHLPAIGSSIDL